MTELFAFPKFLWFFLYGGFLALALLRWIPSKRTRLLTRFISSPALQQMLQGPGKDLRNLKARLALTGLLLTILALAGPQWGIKISETPLLGSNLVIVLDVSDSMLAGDVKPNRFERAKFELLSAYARPGAGNAYRIGLVTFAGRAYLQCPLTLDTGALRFAIETVGPGSLPYAGSDISVGLKTAQSILSKAAGLKEILLVTDGEDHEGDARSLIPQLQKNRIRVSSLWIGSPQGEPIPMRDENGNFLGYKKDKEGRTVLTRAKGDGVQELAQKTGGRFIPLDNATDPQAELRAILENPDAQKGKGREAQLQNRFQIPLAMGFLLLLAELALPEKRT